MADMPAHSLAEQSAAAAAGRGPVRSLRNSAASGFAERIVRRRLGSYASCVHPIQARLTVSRSPAARR
jgi:hypothetical protein